MLLLYVNENIVAVGLLLLIAYEGKRANCINFIRLCIYSYRFTYTCFR